MYEVVGPFILFLFGVMLLTEGGHVSQLRLFGQEITPMNKTTFYMVICVMVAVNSVQARYQKKLIALRARNARSAG